MSDGMTFEEFLHYLARTMGAAEVELDADSALADQLPVDSVHMIELAIVLEQELHLDLPEDLDLRQSTPGELYRGYRAVRAGGE